MEDGKIIELFEDGRTEEAFNNIVSSYKERLYWHIRRMAGNHEDADDILQNTFVKIWAGLPSFRGESRLFTWIYRIATNEVITFLGKKRLRACLSFKPYSVIAASEIEADPYFDGDAITRKLYKTIASLPSKQRIVFNMRYFDEMKYEDMSEILGTSVGALKASYHHAYKKIVAQMKENFG